MDMYPEIQIQMKLHIVTDGPGEVQYTTGIGSRDFAMLTCPPPADPGGALTTPHPQIRAPVSSGTTPIIQPLDTSTEESRAPTLGVGPSGDESEGPRRAPVPTVPALPKKHRHHHARHKHHRSDCKHHKRVHTAESQCSLQDSISSQISSVPSPRPPGVTAAPLRPPTTLPSYDILGSTTDPMTCDPTLDDRHFQDDQGSLYSEFPDHLSFNDTLCEPPVPAPRFSKLYFPGKPQPHSQQPSNSSGLTDSGRPRSPSMSSSDLYRDPIAFHQTHEFSPAAQSSPKEQDGYDQPANRHRDADQSYSSGTPIGYMEAANGKQQLHDRMDQSKREAASDWQPRHPDYPSNQSRSVTAPDWRPQNSAEYSAGQSQLETGPDWRPRHPGYPSNQSRTETCGDWRQQNAAEYPASQSKREAASEFQPRHPDYSPNQSRTETAPDWCPKSAAEVPSGQSKRDMAADWRPRHPDCPSNQFRTETAPDWCPKSAAEVPAGLSKRDMASDWRPRDPEYLSNQSRNETAPDWRPQNAAEYPSSQSKRSDAPSRREKVPGWSTKTDQYAASQPKQETNRDWRTQSVGNDYAHNSSQLKREPISDWRAGNAGSESGLNFGRESEPRPDRSSASHYSDEHLRPRSGFAGSDLGCPDVVRTSIAQSQSANDLGESRYPDELRNPGCSYEQPLEIETKFQPSSRSTEELCASYHQKYEQFIGRQTQTAQYANEVPPSVAPRTRAASGSALRTADSSQPRGESQRIVNTPSSQPYMTKLPNITHNLSDSALSKTPQQEPAEAQVPQGVRNIVAAFESRRSEEPEIEFPPPPPLAVPIPPPAPKPEPQAPNGGGGLLKKAPPKRGIETTFGVEGEEEETPTGPHGGSLDRNLDAAGLSSPFEAFEILRRVESTVRKVLEDRGDLPRSDPTQAPSLPPRVPSAPLSPILKPRFPKPAEEPDPDVSPPVIHFLRESPRQSFRRRPLDSDAAGRPQSAFGDGPPQGQQGGVLLSKSLTHIPTSKPIYDVPPSPVLRKAPTNDPSHTPSPTSHSSGKSWIYDVPTPYSRPTSSTSSAYVPKNVDEFRPADVTSYARPAVGTNVPPKPKTTAASSSKIFELYTQGNKNRPALSPSLPTAEIAMVKEMPSPRRAEKVIHRPPDPSPPQAPPPPEDTNSIDEEGSSISGIVQNPRTGSYRSSPSSGCVAEENLNDYCQGYNSPSLQMEGDSGTQSRDSLASATSLRADQSAPFYNDPPALSPLQRVASPSSLADPNLLLKQRFLDSYSHAKTPDKPSLKTASPPSGGSGGVPVTKSVSFAPKLDQVRSLVPTLDSSPRQPGRGSSRERVYEESLNTYQERVNNYRVLVQEAIEERVEYFSSRESSTASEKTLTDSSSIDQEGSGIFTVSGKPPSLSSLQPSLSSLREENLGDYDQGRLTPLVTEDGYQSDSQTIPDADPSRQNSLSRMADLVQTSLPFAVASTNTLAEKPPGVLETDL